ncbi:MAG: diadenosine tetraphosphate hydrolase [Chlamydiae bacterium CG10_big_fil_rev_8_21_14_0_10_35_9]|nr:MAG: diadenosine tetraphosphate hydrolase [Chlamydiae bacterium CG10_big_fil_rev_8_21_14_0_10_35_9]
MQEDECVFCQYAKGLKPCHKIWEDEEHLAFLSIFPNTEGYSIVIPKDHYSGYAFDLPDDALSKLTIAAKNVGKLIDAKLDDVGKTALIFEGFGIDHVHAKLFPMHGTRKIAKWEPIIAHLDKYFLKYEGYVSTHDYVRAEDKDLEKLARKIRD